MAKIDTIKEAIRVLKLAEDNADGGFHQEAHALIQISDRYRQLQSSVGSRTIEFDDDEEDTDESDDKDAEDSTSHVYNFTINPASAEKVVENLLYTIKNGKFKNFGGVQ